jgi:signal transduction histidine kinase
MRDVRLRIARSGPDALLSVEDDGPGFDTGELASVLGPGVRGRAAPPGPGVGLGLALADRLARSAGGGVIPRPGPGGLVELRLPAA